MSNDAKDQNLGSNHNLNTKICCDKWYYLKILANTVFVLIAIACAIKYKPTIKLGFKCQDPKLSFPYVSNETVTFPMLLVFTLLGPPSIILLVETYVTKSISVNTLRTTKKWYLEYLSGYLFHLLILSIMKTAYPELRPHFFDLCRPNTMNSCIPGEFVKAYNCTNKKLPELYVSQSHQSFPSGHASLAVYCAYFTVCYVHYCLKSRWLNKLIKPIVVAGIIALGLICSISRITDYWHHWWDVLFGVIFGYINAEYFVTGRCNKFKKKKNNSNYRIVNQNTTNIIV